MTTDQNTALVPEWTQGDRLRKARSVLGLTVREFADLIGVSHGTITNAETDARTVRPITLKAWALATRVSIEWLQFGIGESTSGPPNGGQPVPNQAALDRLAAEKRGTTRKRGTNPGYFPTPARAA